jgi:hypothetical protein
MGRRLLGTARRLGFVGAGRARSIVNAPVPEPAKLHSITGHRRIRDPTQGHLDVSLVELRVLLRDAEDQFGLDPGARRSLTEAGEGETVEMNRSLASTQAESLMRETKFKARRQNVVPAIARNLLVQNQTIRRDMRETVPSFFW